MPAFAYTHNGQNIDGKSFMCQATRFYCSSNSDECQVNKQAIYSTGLCTFNAEKNIIETYFQTNKIDNFLVKDLKLSKESEVPSTIDDDLIPTYVENHEFFHLKIQFND